MKTSCIFACQKLFTICNAGWYNPPSQENKISKYENQKTPLFNLGHRDLQLPR